VLFMTNIGTTRSSVAYLIEVLVKIAEELEENDEASKPLERQQRQERVHALTVDLPPLPDFSRFHERFRGSPGGTTGEGDIRTAYFLAGDEDHCEYLRLAALDQALEAGRQVVSAKFVIPYPPGFPLLVPGQVVTVEVAEFMRKLDVKEIHGYDADLGLRVFRPGVLAVTGESPRTESAARSAP